MHAFVKFNSKSVLVTLCLGFIAGICGAQEQVQRPELRSNPLVQQFTRKHGPGWTVRLSSDKQRIESVVGLGTRPYGESLNLLRARS